MRGDGMTLIEAAKLAIDAAENDDPGRVIQLLSQAIAEAEEPVAHVTHKEAQALGMTEDERNLANAFAEVMSNCDPWVYSTIEWEFINKNMQQGPMKVEVAWLTGCPECGMDGGCGCGNGTGQALAKELDGVIVDVEEGDGFDDVCLDTVKYVRDQLAAADTPKEKNA